MMVAAICISIIIGMFIGRFFRNPENGCPAEELGYNCKGSHCDHRLSVLYEAKANMAKYAEEREANKDSNYWGGP